MAGKTLHISLFLLFSAGLYAQQKPEIQNFKAQHSDGIVYLEWVMKTGSVCEGIRITRSYDSLHFEEIGEIAGFCGSLSSPVTYRFQDADPFKNRKIYYRLELGGLTQSGIITAFVPDAGFGQYSIFPNPVTSNSVLQFYNPRNEIAEFRIIDMRGAERSIQRTSGETIDISKDGLEPGLYFFILFSESGKEIIVKGNFLVAGYE